MNPYLSTIFAYLDPGSGSMLLQALLGGVGGVIVLLKMYWHRFEGYLGMRRKTPDSDVNRTT